MTVGLAVLVSVLDGEAVPVVEEVDVLVPLFVDVLDDVLEADDEAVAEFDAVPVGVDVPVDEGLDVPVTVEVDEGVPVAVDEELDVPVPVLVCELEGV